LHAVIAPEELKREVCRCVALVGAESVARDCASCQLAHALSHRRQMRREATALAPDDSRRNENVSPVVTPVEKQSNVTAEKHVAVVEISLYHDLLMVIP
jgi:hypothetical protein